MAFMYPRRKTLAAFLFTAGLTGLAAGSLTAQDAIPDENIPEETTPMMQGDEPRIAPEDARRGEALAVTLSGDNRIDALLSGYKFATSNLTFSFYENDVYHGSYYGSETGVKEVSDAVKNNVREILAWYSTLTNLTFTEVNEKNGQVGVIRIMCSSAPSYAYAYYPTSTSTGSVAGDVHLNSNYDHANDTNGFRNPAGKHGYMSLVHELGHAIGLKHPHQGSPVLPSDTNNTAHTVMSYTFTGNSSATPMTYDILALHYLYGAKANRTGSDTYNFTRSTDQYKFNGGTTYIATPHYTKQTIWDSAGINTLDLSAVPNVSGGYSIDLNEGGWIIPLNQYKTTYYNYGTSIAYGTNVRNLVNSPADDVIFANGSPNVFKGYSPSKATGQDVIYDANGADTIDLTAYSAGAVSQSRTGNDLRISLGSNGTITVKDYYAGHQPVIQLGTTATKPSIKINDVTVTEGNSGSKYANFTVTLSSQASQSVTVNYATANSTAVSGSDYSAKSGTLMFMAGETNKTISVAVIGDTEVENDEFFYVNLSGVSANATIDDNKGIGTILNDDQASSGSGGGGNQAPVAYLNTSAASGKAPFSPGLNASGTYDPDGEVKSYTWKLGDGTTRYGKWISHTYENPGTYTVTLTVEDNQGAKTVKTMSLTATGTSTTPPPPNPDPDPEPDPNNGNTIHVHSITMSKVVSNGTSARALVYVYDNSGKPVSGVEITGTWSGIYTGTQTGYSGSAGGFAFNTPKVSSSGTATFTVKSLKKNGYTYAVSQNLESSGSATLTASTVPEHTPANGKKIDRRQ